MFEGFGGGGGKRGPRFYKLHSVSQIIAPALISILKCHKDYYFFEYTCSENDCNRTFHLINSFKKYLATHSFHSTLYPCSKVKSPRVTSGDNCSSSVNNCNSSTLNLRCNNGIETSYTPFEKDTSGNNCNIQVPRNVVRTIVDDMSLIFDGINHTLRSSVS